VRLGLSVFLSADPHDATMTCLSRRSQGHITLHALSVAKANTSPALFTGTSQPGMNCRPATRAMVNKERPNINPWPSGSVQPSSPCGLCTVLCGTMLHWARILACATCSCAISIQHPKPISMQHLWDLECLGAFESPLVTVCT
jgi:hypothetical protein